MTHITSNEEFELEVIQAVEPVMVDFWATWCGPCKMVDQELPKLTGIKIVKVDVDDLQDIGSRFNVRAIPTAIFFKHGEEVRREIGARKAVEYQNIIDTL